MTYDRSIDLPPAGPSMTGNDELQLKLLRVVDAPIKVKAYTTFSITLCCTREPVDDDAFFVYRKTNHPYQDGSAQMFPVAGALRAVQDGRYFTFQDLMFFDPSFEDKASGIWNLEFVLQNLGYGVISTLIVPIEVESN
ncbi:LOW QUALITY PROTEIN: hypothetical protein NLU13_4817 [Sarocladium strictum]|uniref:Uncharacterized protein n=1 Tax=Sarocladium strictum TaxID=5046 RepID=A0AA39GKD8_SARSR|nr:LOW QUALITY PROTEIN: hypothetical protein NLU13_4817 [Sarocladium strictum]